MGKLILESGIEDEKGLIKEYISARDRQAEIEHQFCLRTPVCIECKLFNHCVTASIAPNGIRK